MTIEIAIRNILTSLGDLSGIPVQIPFVQQGQGHPQIAVRLESEVPEHALDGDLAMSKANVIVEVHDKDWETMRAKTIVIQNHFKDFKGTDAGTGIEIKESYRNRTDYGESDTQSADDVRVFASEIDFNFNYI